MVYDGGYHKIDTVGVYAGSRPVGAAYHPVEAEAYFPWANSSLVRVYDMTTMKEVREYDFVGYFNNYIGSAFDSARTKLSRDGSLLMVSVPDGVRFLQMYSPLSAENLSAATLVNTSVAIPLRGSIGNRGALAYSITQQPSHGSINLGGATATYTPAANFLGADSFAYRVTYGRATRDATGSVTVKSPGQNHPPVAVADAAVAHGYPILVPVLANDSDPDGDALTIIAVTQPVGGRTRLYGKAVMFTPALNWSGPAKFTYSISDHHGGTSSAVVTVTRAAVLGH